MALFEKRGQWYIDYYVEGRRVREKIGPSKRLAGRALTARRGEIITGRFRLDDARRSPRFEELAKEYLAWAKANKRAWRRDETHVAHLRRALDGRRLREISPWLVEKYKRERLAAKVKERPIRPTTINRELSCLRRMFNLARQWGKAEQNPVRGVKFFPEDGQRERILSPDEIQPLLGACTDAWRPIVLLALNTGMRRGEILGLTWEQVDLSHRVITLTKTKSGKIRRVPMNDLVWEALRKLPRTGPTLFGGDRRCGAIRTTWLAICERAGLSGVRFHDLRHTAATYMVLGGQDLATVKEILGHSTVTLTMRYTHPTPESKRRAVGILAELLAARDGHQADTTASAVNADAAPSVRSYESGGVAERLKAPVLKTGMGASPRGFESLPLRHSSHGSPLS